MTMRIYSLLCFYLTIVCYTHYNYGLSFLGMIFNKWWPMNQACPQFILEVYYTCVRFPMVSLEFFIGIILLAALWPWG